MYMCTLRPGYDGCVLVCVLRDGGGGVVVEEKLFLTFTQVNSIVHM